MDAENADQPSRNPFRNLGIGGLLVVLLLGGLLAGMGLGIYAIVQTVRSDAQILADIGPATDLRPDHPRSLFFQVNLLPALQRVGREVGRDGTVYRLQVEPGALKGVWRKPDGPDESFQLSADGQLSVTPATGGGADPIPLDRLDPTVPERMIEGMFETGATIQDVAFFTPVANEGEELLEWLAVMRDGVEPARFRSDERGQIVRPA